MKTTFPTFTCFAGMGLTIGLIVPTVFELAQPPASQSRMASMEASALAVLLVTLLACGLIFVWGKPPKEPKSPLDAGPQFGLRQIFLFITWAAACLATGVWIDRNALVATVALGLAWWSLFQGPVARSRIGGLLACMFCPFVWMIPFNVPLGLSSGLARNLPVGPGVLPAQLIRVSLWDMEIEASHHLAAALVVVQLLIGAWFVLQGPKRAAAFTAVSLIAASLGSLAVHALYRM